MLLNNQAIDLNAEPFRIAQLMRDFHQPWSFCGGWAIDLLLGEQTRQHKDIDIAILRQHQLDARSYLMARGWTLEKAHKGKLSPWTGDEFVQLPVHAIWCKNPDYNPSFLEILLNESEGDYFCFRRERSITLELNQVFVRSGIGLPVLAPEVVLLYKAKEAESNEADFCNGLPLLNDKQRKWLRQSLLRLYPEHKWLSALEGA
jgi:hypothetical protein